MPCHAERPPAVPWHGLQQHWPTALASSSNGGAAGPACASLHASTGGPGAATVHERCVCAPAPPACCIIAGSHYHSQALQRARLGSLHRGSQSQQGAGALAPMQAHGSPSKHVACDAAGRGICRAREFPSKHVACEASVCQLTAAGGGPSPHRLQAAACRCRPRRPPRRLHSQLVVAKYTSVGGPFEEQQPANVAAPAPSHRLQAATVQTAHACAGNARPAKAGLGGMSAQGVQSHLAHPPRCKPTRGEMQVHRRLEIVPCGFQHCQGSGLHART